MNKFIASAALAMAVLAHGSASGASATGPTCADTLPVKNHGEHVLEYVNSPGGAAGGKPAHHSDDRPTAPAPGASFCLDQAQNPGLHF